MASPNTLARRMDELRAEAGISGLSHARVRRIMGKHRDAYKRLDQEIQHAAAAAAVSDRANQARPEADSQAHE